MTSSKSGSDTNNTENCSSAFVDVEQPVLLTSLSRQSPLVGGK